MQPHPLRLRLAALLGLAAIILGSLGAHGKVHDALVASGSLDNWKTALSYHLPHTVLLVLLALVGSAGGRGATWAWRCVFAGVLLFSGSLYIHALTHIHGLVYVTPFGGVTMMAGWACLLFSRWQRPAF
ncbi:DUF423 domain-containing protein [Prosthecobacter sp. SYSU 5D2]|uniref:DUF423 domain-containing protein n=1 Tax=Prosthecobacter sp. SYSU 5D2 TaxID=3134134 RepID=UPI0031FEFD97